MTDETMRHLGCLYRALSDACSKSGASQTDLAVAHIHPLRYVSMAISRAHALHKMTADLDAMTGYVLAEISLEEMQADFGDKPAFPAQQRAQFMLGYQLGPEGLCVPASSIKQARQAAGFTVRGLAEKIGVAASTIAEVEAGRKVPRADTLRKIADACGTTMDAIWPSGEV